MSEQTVEGVRYHSRETLQPTTLAKGVEMWSVSLKKILLTWFRVAPNSTFRRHRHVSEQITMVLEGELFFKVGDREFGVKSGEVLAIPPRIPHSAFTKASSCVAVDAWSPVRSRYREIESDVLAVERILVGGVGMMP